MTCFEWNETKNKENIRKHDVSFYQAQYAFFDKQRLIIEDLDHSTDHEKRYFCIGKIDDGIITVRFTYRNKKIRIFGAGFWRKGKKTYEQENRLH